MASLVETLLGAQSPVTQWTQRNSNLLTGLGTSLLSDGMNFAPAQQGAMMDRQVAAQKDADAKLAASMSATTGWLTKNYPQYANLPPSEGFKLAMQAEQAKYGGGSSDETFFSPTMGTIDGKPAWVQFGNKGTVRPAEVPEGFTPQSRYEKLDLGTHYRITDTTTGQTWDEPKQNEQAARDTAVGANLGKADAENIAAADSLASKMPGLQTVVGELSELAKTATYTQTGQLIDTIARETGAVPGEAAVARTKYIAMVDNQVLPLLRDTFGAAFTVKEGETLRATLGDPNKAPAEKQAILEAFIEQKVRDLEAMQSRIPSGGGAAGNVTSTGVPWSLE